MKTQALEWDGEQDNIAILGDFAARLPDGVKAEVVIVNAFCGDSVQLNAQRIGKEFVGALAVMKGVQRDAYSVVTGNVFPLYHVGAQRVRRRLADEAYVEK